MHSLKANVISPLCNSSSLMLTIFAPFGFHSYLLFSLSLLQLRFHFFFFFLHFVDLPLSFPIYCFPKLFLFFLLSHPRRRSRISFRCMFCTSCFWDSAVIRLCWVYGGFGLHLTVLRWRSKHKPKNEIRKIVIIYILATTISVIKMDCSTWCLISHHFEPPTSRSVSLQKKVAGVTIKAYNLSKGDLNHDSFSVKMHFFTFTGKKPALWKDDISSVCVK